MSSSKQESFNYNFIFWFLIIQSMFFCLHSLQESSSSKNDPNGGGRRIIKCIESEREALLTFKAGLTDPTNLLSSWEGHQDDCCKWWGVSCNKNTSHVIGLNLRGTWDEVDNTYVRYQLGGEITPSLLHLKHLRHLDLSFNNFSGTSIPKFIGSFRKLTYLNLSASIFVGLVPPQLGNLSRLRYLDLRYLDLNQNEAYVDNLRWLPRLSSLKYLDLTFVNLNSVVDWFQMVNMLPSLTTLNLRSCFLPSIPTSSLSYINFSTSLNTLDLSFNHFNSSLPQWIWNISSLTNLDLSFNNFHGPIPDAVGSLTKLTYLNLYSAGFVGLVPPQLGNLSHLRYLDLGNQDDMHVDNLRWLPRLSSLKYLDMGNVNLSSVVDWFQMVNMLPSLTTLNLRSCFLPSIPTSSLSYINFSTSLNTLDLSGNYINSSLPQWIWNISSLTNLDLSDNSFHGPIPDAVGSFVSLEVLQLDYNNLDGIIPIRKITNLCRLTTLDLSYNNNLRGDIGGLVDSVWNCTHPMLQRLWLSDNQLSGKLTSGIQHLRSLNSLHLSNNQLHGPIPVEIGKLSQLSEIDLSNNSFSGLVSESHFTNLTNLKTLILSMNPLTFSVDESWVPSFQLEDLELGSLPLGPHFPSWLHNQFELQTLSLSNCGISGTVPDWFWKKMSRPSIDFLDLSNNQITGKLPNFIKIRQNSEIHLSSNLFEGLLPPAVLSNAWILDLSNNSFSGPLPEIKVPYLSILDLSNNHFNSSMPSSLCKGGYSYMGYILLDLSNNDLSGEIPDEWQMQSPPNIILANNCFCGRVPKSLGNVANLEALVLRNNNLSGLFPKFLQTCHDLAYLDLSQNKFFGNIPTWLGENLTSLSFLSLRSNLFFGNIPPQFGQLQNLIFLDLANNSLSGSIPHCLGNFTAMASTDHPDFEFFYLDSDSYSFAFYFSFLGFTKGEELEYSKNQYLTSIDLSDNYLIGGIPEEIEALIGLVNLNLSSNRLKGNIPGNIGRMRSLESLDLSRNELSGNIPLSISDLDFLSHLNLSYNHLSGKIPSGNQIQTLLDPSIYAGNIGLCGPPLPTNCSSSGSDAANTGEYDQGDEERVWLYYSIGLGYIVGFWAVCGVLLFKKTWRRAYFQFFDDMCDWLYVSVSLTLAKLKSTGQGRN